MLLRTVLALVCLVAIAPCQGGEAGEEAGQVIRGVDDSSKRGKADDEKNLEKNLTPEQMLARNVTTGASAFCRFHATVKPAKLMPGQSGVVSVAAILLGDAVIPSPPQVEMIAALQQGVFTLGAMSFQPADVGKHAKGYLGRPVYDNFAIFEVPVTVAPEAEVGKKHRVAIDMRFDLYNGTSAQPVGRFIDQVSAEIEIGRALDPAIAQRTGTASPADVRRAGVEPPTASSLPVDEPKPAARVLEGTAIVPAAAPVQSQQVEPAPAEIPVGIDDSETLLPLPLLVGGGVLLLGIVLLLARKK
ncbi:MAG TPA: hypothetical protein VF384_16510 [Planctomycetota bacterium]